MDTPPASTRALAQRLLAAEAASPSGAGPHVHEADRLCEKLRVALTRFAGVDGFESLLRRALVLARAESPTLHGIAALADGSRDELAKILAEDPEAAVAIVGHLLGLLTTFIGAGLTRRLVGEVWPDVLSDD